MSDGLQCPACDVVIAYEDAEGNKSLSQLLGAGVSQSVSDLTEQRLIEHLNSHTVEDWVTALVMADRYIERLEGALEGEKRKVEALATRQKQIDQAVAEMRTRQAAPRPMPAVDAGFGPPPPILPGPPGTDFGPDWVQPDRRPSPRRQHVDSEKTLIPHIPMGQRPEGVVGRKT